ncbi:uncharacterized protein LOC114287600 isoform X2 [Camellia sinensis]|uniref:uncharacterized protein LOC114287600 isoform X2 n=1 Tax=Camellia sinensis TaxID=4442 RepID=UPI001036C982|nr:uncharacterized protein LOC114287600 isoform X2 [Camellia sinensis]
MGRDNKSKRRRTVNLKLKDKMQANDAEINKIRAKKLLANELGITFVSFSQNNHDPSKLVAETPCELLRLSGDTVPFDYSEKALMILTMTKNGRGWKT